MNILDRQIQMMETVRLYHVATPFVNPIVLTICPMLFCLAYALHTYRVAEVVIFAKIPEVEIGLNRKLTVRNFVKIAR